MQRSSQSVIAMTIITLAIIMAVGSFLAWIYLRNRLANPVAEVPVAEVIDDGRSPEEQPFVQPVMPEQELGGGGQDEGGVEELPTAVPPPPPPTATFAPPPTPTRSPNPIIFIEYLVQPNDGLWRIVEKHNYATSISLMAQYGISTDDIVPGHLIKQLPVGNPEYCQPYRVYAVAEGDTVHSLTRRFNKTVEAIQQANNLGPDSLIYAAEILCIP